RLLNSCLPAVFLRPCSVSPLFPFLSSLFHHTPTTDIYTLSLHDALPIFEKIVADSGLKAEVRGRGMFLGIDCENPALADKIAAADRKSTRLNSSHVSISYAVFCLKKKKTLIKQVLPDKTF